MNLKNLHINNQFKPKLLTLFSIFDMTLDSSSYLEDINSSSDAINS